MQDWISGKRRKNNYSRRTGGMLITNEDKIEEIKQTLINLEPILPNPLDTGIQMCIQIDNGIYLLYNTLNGEPILTTNIPFYPFDPYNTILWIENIENESLSAIHVTKEVLDTNYYKKETLYKETAARFANLTYGEISTITHDKLQQTMKVYSINLNSIVEYPIDTRILHTLDGQTSIEPSQLQDLPSLIWKKDENGNHAIVLVVNGNNYDPSWVPKINYWFKNKLQNKETTKQKLVWDIKEIQKYYNDHIYENNKFKYILKKAAPWAAAVGSLSLLVGAAYYGATSLAASAGSSLINAVTGSNQSGQTSGFLPPASSTAGFYDIDQLHNEEVSLAGDIIQDVIENDQDNTGDTQNGDSNSVSDINDETKGLWDGVKSIGSSIGKAVSSAAGSAIANSVVNTVTGQKPFGPEPKPDNYQEESTESTETTESAPTTQNNQALTARIGNWLSKLPAKLVEWYTKKSKVDEWYESLGEIYDPPNVKTKRCDDLLQFISVYPISNAKDWLNNMIEQLQIKIDGTCDIKRLFENSYTFDDIRRLLDIAYPNNNLDFSDDFFDYMFCFSKEFCLMDRKVSRWTTDLVTQQWDMYGTRIQELRNKYKTQVSKKWLFFGGNVMEGPPSEKDLNELQRRIEFSTPRFVVRKYIKDRAKEAGTALFHFAENNVRKHGKELLNLGNEAITNSIDVAKNRHRAWYKERVNDYLVRQSNANATKRNAYVNNIGSTAKAFVNNVGDTLNTGAKHFADITKNVGQGVGEIAKMKTAWLNIGTMPQSIQNERSKLELQDFMNKSNILSKSLGIKPEEAYKIVRPAILENPNVQKFIENINKSKEESNQKENQNAQPAPARQPAPASTQAAPAQPAPSNGYQNVQPAPAIGYAQPYVQAYGYPQPQPYGYVQPQPYVQPYVQPYAQPQAYGYPNMMDNWYQSKVTTEMEARRRQQEEQNRNVAYYQPDSSPEVENESDEADLVSDVGQIM